MASEDELLVKLERWMAEQPGEPTLADVLGTRDGELFAAFVLKGFRAAAKQAVLDRFEREAPDFPDADVKADNAAIRVFAGLARAWSLTKREQLMLLGLEGAAALEELRRSPRSDLPVEIIERLAILLDIYRSINTLLPAPQRADAWMRSANAASGFAGRSALDIMVEPGLNGLRMVRAYLRGQVSGP